jgi:hypothetical protein
MATQLRDSCLGQATANRNKDLQQTSCHTSPPRARLAAVPASEHTYAQRCTQYCSFVAAKRLIVRAGACTTCGWAGQAQPFQAHAWSSGDPAGLATHTAELNDRQDRIATVGGLSEGSLYKVGIVVKIKTQATVKISMEPQTIMRIEIVTVEC